MTTAKMTHSREIIPSYSEPGTPYCGYNHKHLLDGLNVYGGKSREDKRTKEIHVDVLEVSHTSRSAAASMLMSLGRSIRRWGLAARGCERGRANGKGGT